MGLPEIAILVFEILAKMHYFSSTGQTVVILADDNIVSFVLELKALQKRSDEFFSWVAKIWSFFFEPNFFFGFLPRPVIFSNSSS